MKYDFTSIIERKGKDALAIDLVGEKGSPFPAPKSGFDVIPMWVADMNFATAPCIQEAVIQRMRHPCFGYFEPTEAFYDAVTGWQIRRNGAGMLLDGAAAEGGFLPEHIGYENGVIGGVISAVNVLCSRGDKVLLHSPTYVGFTNSLRNNGYQIVLSALRKDEAGIYRMDLEDMEKKIVSEGIHTAIFCSPHNPAGRVWEREELEQMMALFEKYGVYVISDEIWSDIILTGYKHIPLQSVSGYARSHTAAFYAQSKTFNLAGLVGSYHIIYDKWLRDRIRKEASLSGYNNMNVLWMHALIAAYSEEGEEWTEEMRQVVTENVRYAESFIEEHFPGVETSRPQGTYMLFLDCAEYLRRTGRTLDELLLAGYEVGVVWQDGRAFNGPAHIRVNLALPASRLKEAFGRLAEHVF